MKSYASFCPVAKTAEIFAERWTPLLLRELCCGVQRFSDFQTALPAISRSLLAQRLRELELAGIVERMVDRQGRSSGYRLTAAGEAFRPIIDMMGAWGQSYGRGRIESRDTDPVQLVWAVRRHLDRQTLPDRRFVIRFEFFGLPRGWRESRYFWLVLENPEIDVCQRDPGYPVDAVVLAHLDTMTRVWLGHEGLAAAAGAGRIAFRGEEPAVRTTIEVLMLRDEPWHREFDFSPRPDPFGPPAMRADGEPL